MIFSLIMKKKKNQMVQISEESPWSYVLSRVAIMHRIKLRFKLMELNYL